MKMKLYSSMSGLVLAAYNCVMTNNVEWQSRHERKLLDLVETFFGETTEIDLDGSTGEMLIFVTEHVKGDVAHDYIVIVRASLSESIIVTATSRAKDMEVIHEIESSFAEKLMVEVETGSG
jgi:hypothetical protein